MRHLIYLSLLLIITGCAHNRIQYVKSGKRVVIADRTKQNSKSTDKSYTYTSNEKEAELTEIGFVSTNEEFTSDAEYAETEESFAFENIESRNPADTIRMSKSDYQLMVAEDAEHDARRAKNLFITSLVLLILPIISILSIIPFIIGWFKLYRSNQARYITVTGDSQARQATILRNIYLAIILLILMLVLLLLVIFFF